MPPCIHGRCASGAVLQTSFINTRCSLLLQVYSQAGSIVYETDGLLASRPEEKTPAPTDWRVVARAEDIPEDGGAAIKYGASQIAIFNFKSRGKLMRDPRERLASQKDPVSSWNG